MPYGRDSQRQRLYNAEDEFFKGVGETEPLATITEVRSFLKKKVIQRAWFKKTYGRVTELVIGDGRARRRACGTGHPQRGFGGLHLMMKLPRWSRKRYIVLHELAHGLHAACVMGSASQAWHGPEFCAIYAGLVERVFGKDYALGLRRAFNRHNVDHTSLNRLTITPVYSRSMASKARALSLA